MEKAKLRTKELVEDYDERKGYTHEETLNELKPEINNLLHTYLPDEITIKQAEILAMVMLEMIMNPKDFLEQ